jgi:mannose-1-phosphate guanylyltransferase
MSRWAAVLAGGSGTRFWPLSGAATPKQLLPLVGDEPLLRMTITRLQGLIPPARTLVITSRDLVDAIRQILPELPGENFLAEPRAASTGPALAWATVVAAQRDSHASLLSLHADWHVADPAAFRETAAHALEVAEHHDALVTVGIAPRRPDPGYGYIEPGEPVARRAFAVKAFREKPDRPTAERLVAAGALWNSGLFAWTAVRFLEETRTVAPEIAPHLANLERGAVEAFYEVVTPIPVDMSHFERSDRVIVVPGDFPWDDVGTWAALARVRQCDDQGNVLVGSAVQWEASDCVAWAEDGSIVLFGVKDLVAVHANGVTLVTTKERAANLKELLASLPDAIRRPESRGD